MSPRRLRGNALGRSLAAALVSSAFVLLSIGCAQGESEVLHEHVTTQKLSLSDGLQRATERSRVVQIAMLNTDMASTDVNLAKSRYFPSIRTSLSQTFLAYQPGVFLGSQKLTAPTSESSYLSYDLTLSQTLYDFGGRSSVYEASKTAVEVTKLDLDRTRNAIALDFVISYLDLLETEKLILVVRREVESLQSHLSVAKSLYEEGAITRNDLLEAQVRVADARQRLLSSQNLRAVTASRLNTILSWPLTDEIEVTDSPITVAEPLDLATGWKRAEEERWEVKILDNELRIAGLQEKAKKSEFFPSLFAQGGFNYTENEFQIHESNWSFIVGMNLSIFSGGATTAELSRIRYRKQQLMEQKGKVLDEVRLEVKRNYLDMVNARERIAVTKDAIAQAEENVRINRVRYEEGIGIATEVLDAITLLATTETNYHRAVYAMRRAEAALWYSTGADLVSVYR